MGGAEHILKEILPCGCEVPSSFETIGKSCGVNTYSLLYMYLRLQFYCTKVVYCSMCSHMFVLLEIHSTYLRLEVMVTKNKEILGFLHMSTDPHSCFLLGCSVCLDWSFRAYCTS